MFPTLPSGNNSALGAAGSAASGAAAVYNSLQSRLQQALQNKAAQQRQKDQDDAAATQKEFAARLDLHKAGGIPVNLPGHDDSSDESGGPTLRRAIANPAAQGDGQTLTTPGGMSYYMPTEREKAASKLDATNSFVAPPGGDTEKWMQESLGIQPGTPIPLSHLPAITGFQKELQATADAVEKKKQVGIVGQDASDKAKALGIELPVGTHVPLGELKSVLEGITPKEKPEKPPRTRVDLTNFNTPVSVNEDSGEITPLKLPTGVSRQMSPAAIEADKDRHARAAEISANAAERKATQSQAVKNELIRVNREFKNSKLKVRGALEKVINDEFATDAQRLEAARAFKQDNQDLQTSYETDINTAQGGDVGHDAWADKIDPATLPGVRPKQPADGKPAQAAQQAPAKPAAPKYKVGETRTHEGATYSFDGKQWVQQAAPKTAAQAPPSAPVKAVPKLGDVKTYNGAQYKFDGKQYVYAGAATNATR